MLKTSYCLAVPTNLQKSSHPVTSKTVTFHPKPQWPCPPVATRHVIVSDLFGLRTLARLPPLSSTVTSQNSNGCESKQNHGGARFSKHQCCHAEKTADRADVFSLVMFEELMPHPLLMAGSVLATSETFKALRRTSMVRLLIERHADQREQFNHPFLA